MLQALKTRRIAEIAVSIVLVLGGTRVVGQGPQLSFRSTSGQSINLADDRGKVVVLSFSATWAPLVSSELRALQKVADAYAGRGVLVNWVSINTSKQGARNYASDGDLTAFATRYGLKVPVLRDPEQTVYHALGLDALPTIVVIDRTGRVVLRHVGFDPDQVEPLGDVTRAIDGLLK